MPRVEEALRRMIRQTAKNFPAVDLLLSGGCDSVALLICAKEEGLRVNTHTYHLGALTEDASVAEKVAEQFECPWVSYPITEAQACGAVFDLKDKGIFPVSRLTNASIALGHYFIFKNHSGKTFYSGASADVLFGTAYSMRVKLCSKKNAYAGSFDDLRREWLAGEHETDPEAVKTVQSVAESTGNRVLYPFLDEGVVEAFSEEVKTPDKPKKHFYKWFGDRIPAGVKKRPQNIASGLTPFLRSSGLARLAVGSPARGRKGGKNG